MKHNNMSRDEEMSMTSYLTYILREIINNIPLG